MADNYLEFSEILEDLTPDEEAWLHEQLEIVYLHDGKEYTEENVPEGFDESKEWCGCRALRDLAEYEPEDQLPLGFEYQFDDTLDGQCRYLWLFADECGCPERVAHLVRKFLKQFRPGQYWTLSYANTCSKPRRGAFGGGCAFVTATQVEWCSTWDFLDGHVRALEDANTQTPQTHPESPAAKNNRPRTYDLAIDGPALRRQRQWLLDMADGLSRGIGPVFTPTDAELLEGLVNLTDAIADQAADRFRIDCLLAAPEEAKQGDSEDETLPEDRLARLVDELGLAAEDLDGIVHDVASETASDINNGGVSRQLEYLLDQLGEEGTQRDLRLLAEGKGGTP